MNTGLMVAEAADPVDGITATRFSNEELIDISNGTGPIPCFPRLPKPGMLMLDRIIDIDRTGGRYASGLIRAEFDISPDQWFFQCHFDQDPVMPGSLGVDGLCQLLGFYLGWMGYKGKGRALGIGKTRFRNEVGPVSTKLEYQVDLKLLKDTHLPYAIADGAIYAGQQLITEVNSIRVGIRPDANM